MNRQGPFGRLVYSQRGLPMPNRRKFCSRVARMGVEPTDIHEGLSFAALPVCVPCCLVQRPRWDLNPGTDRARMPGLVLLRDRQASTPGCSTRTYCHVSSSGGTRTHSIPGSKPRWSADCLPSHLFRQCPEQDSNLQTPGFKPSRSADWRIWAKVVPDGLEPSVVTL